MSGLDEKDTFELVYQIVVGIRRRKNDNEALRGVLTEISRVTANWQPKANSGTENKAKVIFALNPETSGWSAAGVDSTEVKSWEMIGFTSDYTQLWHDANLNLAHALKWSAVWNLTSLDPKEISKWEHSTAAFTDPNTVSMWFRTSVTTERAIEWTAAGGAFYGGKEWLSAYPDVDATELQQTEALGLSLPESRPWIDRQIIGAEIETFMSKGYTPAAARKYLDGGGTLANLPDKKGDALVIGRSWSRISAIIATNPDITATATQTGKTTQVELTHKSHPKPIVITFHRNGRYADSQTTKDQAYRSFSGQQYTAPRTVVMKLNELLDHLKSWK